MLLLALLAATTATVTVDPGAGCPSSEQLSHALSGLAPGIIAPLGTPPGAPAAGAPASLRLVVVTSAEGDVRVDLLDPQGEAALHRVLPAPPRGRAPDCAALADTIALIVDRYLRDVGYEAPPLAPPAKPAPPSPAPTPAEPTDVVTAQPAAAPAAPPAATGATWRLGLVASGRRGDSGGADGDGALAIAVETGGEGVRLGARLSAGLAPAADARWTAQGASRSATLRRLPFRMGGYVAIAAGPGQLEPGVGLGADLYLVSANTGDGQHTAPFADAALAYTLSLMKPVYLRLLSRIALAVPYDFNTLSGSRVWGTSRTYGEVGVEFGLVFQ